MNTNYNLAPAHGNILRNEFFFDLYPPGEKAKVNNNLVKSVAFLSPSGSVEISQEILSKILVNQQYLRNEHSKATSCISFWSYFSRFDTYHRHFWRIKPR